MCALLIFNAPRAAPRTYPFRDHGHVFLHEVFAVGVLEEERDRTRALRLRHAHRVGRVVVADAPLRRRERVAHAS